MVCGECGQRIWRNRELGDCGIHLWTSAEMTMPTAATAASWSTSTSSITVLRRPLQPEPGIRPYRDTVVYAGWEKNIAEPSFKLRRHLIADLDVFIHLVPVKKLPQIDGRHLYVPPFRILGGSGRVLNGAPAESGTLDKNQPFSCGKR